MAAVAIQPFAQLEDLLEEAALQGRNSRPRLSGLPRLIRVHLTHHCMARVGNFTYGDLTPSSTTLGKSENVDATREKDSAEQGASFSL